MQIGHASKGVDVGGVPLVKEHAQLLQALHARQGLGIQVDKLQVEAFQIVKLGHATIPREAVIYWHAVELQQPSSCENPFKQGKFGLSKLPPLSMQDKQILSTNQFRFLGAEGRHDPHPAVSRSSSCQSDPKMAFVKFRHQTRLRMSVWHVYIYSLTS